MCHYWRASRPESGRSNCHFRAANGMVRASLRRSRVLIDRSAIEAFRSYVRIKTDENLNRLASTLGGRLAYRHHKWSSVSSGLTIREFWKQQLRGVTWSEQLENSIEVIIRRLCNREKYWLETALRYLPRGHVFNTTVYLIGGYDSVVCGEDVALNLNSSQFHRDHREAEYYLIHELAHAGYFKYRRMPNLAGLKTRRRLVATVRLLTHLEGMGVISSLQQRLKEGGLLDPDYQVLLNERKTNELVCEYFARLRNIQKGGGRQRYDYRRLDEFNAQPKRLWYIAGGHMALKIEAEYGRKRLQDAVRSGPEEFFRAYLETQNR